MVCSPPLSLGSVVDGVVANALGTGDIFELNFLGSIMAIAAAVILIVAGDRIGSRQALWWLTGREGLASRRQALCMLGQHSGGRGGEQHVTSGQGTKLLTVRRGDSEAGHDDRELAAGDEHCSGA